MKKQIVFLLVIALLATTLAGCHARKPEAVPVKSGQEAGSFEIKCVSTGIAYMEV